MERAPRFGETYFYIDGDKVVSRVNTLQDIDILNGMRYNYYFDEKKARLDLQYKRTRGAKK